jgi:hypothetical protein
MAKSGRVCGLIVTLPYSTVAATVCFINSSPVNSAAVIAGPPGY